MIRATLLLWLLPVAALAQVSVNRGALDQLQPAAPASSAPASSTPTRTQPARPLAPRTASRPSHTSPAAASAPASPAKPKPKPRAVSVAPAPPPVAVLPPPAEAPKPAVTPPPPPVPIVADAVGEVTVINAGVRITFGSGKADLNQTTVNGIIAVARQVKADPNTDLTVFAYATGVPEDPSTPRRLSLSRALAVRAVLISEGITSTRIYVRALGAAPSDGPADRVDIVRAGTPTSDAKP